MSLFQAREWWSAKAGQDEEFDVGCMCIGNIDNEPNGTSKIITGSFQGMLRMYCPKQKEYKVEDLIMEKQLDAPIICLAAGKFVQGSREVCLAVLHPKKAISLHGFCRLIGTSWRRQLLFLNASIRASAYSIRV